MTNAEYFEKNGVSFSESMKLFNESNINSFDEFLSVEHIEHKFKIGDIVVLQLNGETCILHWKHNVVFKITEFGRSGYTVQYLTPSGNYEINSIRTLSYKFIDNNCKLY